MIEFTVYSWYRSKQMARLHFRPFDYIGNGFLVHVAY
jgi:hypothetical protein